MADHPHLLGDDVELLSGFYADFDQGTAVVRAEAQGDGQFVTLYLAWQSRIEWFAPTLGFGGARGGHCTGLLVQRVALRVGAFFLRRGGLRQSQALGFVEEQVFLIRTAHFAACGEHLVDGARQLFFEQVALDAQYPVLTGQGVAFGLQGVALILHGGMRCLQ